MSENNYGMSAEFDSAADVLSAAKRVRSETRIGANAVSLASASVSLARRVYADLSVHSALMIGSSRAIGIVYYGPHDNPLAMLREREQPCRPIKVQMESRSTKSPSKFFPA